MPKTPVTPANGIKKEEIIDFMQNGLALNVPS